MRQPRTRRPRIEPPAPKVRSPYRPLCLDCDETAVKQDRCEAHWIAASQAFLDAHPTEFVADVVKQWNAMHAGSIT